MEKQYREMINTRRLYKFEEEFFFFNREYKPITKQLPITDIRRIGNFIWEQEKRKDTVPEIRFGKGIYHTQARGRNYYYSWCDGQTIELAPTQRDIVTLIHELVHALGYDYHNSRFVEKYIYLLVKYTDIKKKDIILGMRRYDVALPVKYKRLYQKCPTRKIHTSKRKKR